MPSRDPVADAPAASEGPSPDDDSPDENESFLARGVMRLCWLLAALASCFVDAGAQTELVVAADGSAKYRTVQEAVMAVPAGSPSNPVVIRIKPGRDRELVYVQREKRFFRLVGEDAARTVITHDLHANLKGHDDKPIGTFRTPTVTVDADDLRNERRRGRNSSAG